MTKKFLILTLVVAICIIGAAAFVFREKNKIDPTIKGTADSYIVSLVGESEFNKNYAFDYEKSERCKDNDKAGGGCYIRYKFLPAEEFGGSEYLFFYTFANNKVSIANNGVPITLPSCEQDKNKCDFKISFEDLKEIARREKLNDQFVELISYNGEIVGEISYCNLETTENRRKIYVNLQDGSILWSGPNSECQGIN